MTGESHSYPPSQGVPRRRAADDGTISKVAVLYDRYKWLGPIVAALYFSLGFGFRTPKAAMDEIRREIQLNREWTQAVIDTMQAHDAERNQQFGSALETLRVFTVDLCVRRRDDPYIFDRLQCRMILNQQRQDDANGVKR